MKDTLSRKLSLARRGIVNFIHKRPMAISFEVTHCCNAKCKHCHLGGTVKEHRAAPERYGELCRQLKPVVAQISGGEPLLRRDLEEIVAALRTPNRAPYITLTTNAATLSKKRYAALREKGVDEYSISFDYPDERHDEYRGIPGLYSRIHDLIAEVGKNNDNAVTLCCVIQSDNFRQLLPMAELATSWNVRINFSFYTSLRTHDKSYMISDNDMAEYREIVARLLQHKKTYRNIRTSEYAFKRSFEYFRTGRILHCRTGTRFYNINPDGTFSPCGLIITDYKTFEEFYRDFVPKNTCDLCYTSIRANCERPAKYLFLDNVTAFYEEWISRGVKKESLAYDR